jgi:hypothetical protein
MLSLCDGKSPNVVSALLNCFAQAQKIGIITLKFCYFENVLYETLSDALCKYWVVIIEVIMSCTFSLQNSGVPMSR